MVATMAPTSGGSRSMRRGEALSRFMWTATVAGLLAACSPGATGPDPSLMAGREALRRHALREAVAHYRIAATRFPSSAPVQLEHGRVAAQLGEYDEALKAYQAAATLAPTFENIRSVGVLAAGMGEAELARRSFERSLSMSPLRRARDAFGAGVADTIECLGSPGADGWACALSSFALHGRAYRAGPRQAAQELFEVLVETGDRPAALALAKEWGWAPPGANHCGTAAPGISPRTAALLAALVHPGHAPCVEPAALSLIDEYGRGRLARILLGETIRRASDGPTRERMELLVRIRLPARDAPRRAESLNVTGRQLKGLRNYDDAIGAFQKAIVLDPGFSWPYRGIGLVYWDLKDEGRALEWFQKAVTVNPNHWRAYSSFGAIAFRLERYEQALEAFRRAVALNPDDAYAHASIGRLLLRSGRESEAIRELQTAVRLDPSFHQERALLNARLGADPRGSPTPFGAR